MDKLIAEALDQTELYQLAWQASAAGDGARAIAYLKEATGRADASAAAHYLLGAEYAQIRLYDRAQAAFECALALDPGLSTARLQLGMLLLAGDQLPQAAKVLEPLAALPAGDPARHFGAGMLQLAQAAYSDAAAALRTGIELEQANAPLRTEMERLLQAVTARASAAPAAVAADEADSQHLLLSAYAGNQRH